MINKVKELWNDSTPDMTGMSGRSFLVTIGSLIFITTLIISYVLYLRPLIYPDLY